MHNTRVNQSNPQLICKGELLEPLRRVRPTQLYAVPRHYEKLAARIRSLIAKQHETPSSAMTTTTDAISVVEWARHAALTYHRARIDGSPTHEMTMAYLEATACFLDSFKRQLGLDRARYLMVGGAPMDPQLLEFFLTFDIQLFQEYGLTEVGATNLEHSKCFSPGSVGPVLDGQRVFIDEPDSSSTKGIIGEVLFHGRVRFMGYVGDKEKTSAMFDEKGRVISGDLGFLDARGRLFITGRIKDIIVTSGGKKVSPQRIETILRQLLPPAVSSIVILGEGRKFISALFGLKTYCSNETSGLPTDILAPTSRQWVESLCSSATKVSEIRQSRDPKVYLAIQKAVDEYNAKHSRSSVESVKRWQLLPSEFSVPGGELNNLLKPRRSFIHKKYAQLIESIYNADELHDQCHPNG